MKKKLMLRIITMIIVLLLCNTSWASGESYTPEYIKIGLRYGSQATSVAHLHSDSGFQIGWYNNNLFNELYGLVEYEDLIVRKDSYFIELNNSYVEVPSDYGGNIQGPYHVQIGSNYASKEEMMNDLENLEDKFRDVYPVFDNGWKIWTGLFSSSQKASEFVSDNGEMNDKNLQIVQPNNEIVQVLDNKGNVLFMYNSSREDFHFKSFLEKDSNDIIKLDGKNFRGEIIIQRYGGSDLTVINYISLQEYLYGVLPKEMSGSWPIEALKAQAVAARNFAIANMGKHSSYGFDLCATIDCQVYGGHDVEHERSNKAVDDTIGKVLTYEGNIVNAYFHSSSGGYTEDSENVWGMKIPYIRGVEDEFSLDAPNNSWALVYTADDIENAMKSAGMDVGEVLDVYVQEYSNHDRVIKLKIKGTRGEEILEREKPRAIFGYSTLKSMKFTMNSNGDLYVKHEDGNTKLQMNNIYIKSKNKVSKVSKNNFSVYNGRSYRTTNSGESGKYIFNGSGWGHGLGMSQWGAKKMAELGYTYDQILTHYYRGTILN